MEPYVWGLKAEPDKHSIVIVALVRIAIARKLEVIGAFRRARRRLAYRAPNLPQSALYFFWGACYVFVYVIRWCALGAQFFCHGRMTLTSRMRKVPARNPAQEALRLRPPWRAGSGQAGSIGFDHAGVPVGGILQDTFLRRIIDEDHAEALRVAFLPFEIVEQRPVQIALHGNAFA